MSRRNSSDNGNRFLRAGGGPRWAGRLLGLAVVLVIVGLILSSVWYTFFHYVPPGKMLV